MQRKSSLNRFNKYLLYTNVALAAGIVLVVAASAFTGPTANPPSGSSTGILSITQGGTGATTSAGALSALGAAQAGANSNITSLTGLTTPLPANEGGTGDTSTSYGVLIASGTSAFSTIAPGTSGNVLTSNGSAWVSQAATSSGSSQAFTYNTTAVEAITSGSAVASTLYEAADESIDTETIITGIPAGDTCTGGCGSAATSSYSFTVGNNSDRVLVAIIEGWSDNNNGAGPGVSLTYAGQSFTVASSNGCNISGNACFESVNYLIAPPTGTNSLVTSDTNCGCVLALYSVYNAAQSQPGATMLGTGTTDSVNTIADGEITFGAVDLSSGSPTAGGNIYTSNTQASSTIASGDSGITNLYSIGTKMTLTSSNSSSMLASIGILPYSAVVPGVENASAASSNQRETAFIGFAQNSASAGGSVTVAVSGIATIGLSGIQDGVGYYLGNTNGTIQTTTGSTTRKVGIGVSDTSIDITNEW